MKAVDQGRIGDKRAAARRRTRLRSGKILDTENRFLVECVVHDRSHEGARLRIVENVALTSPLRLFDDEQGTVHELSIVWRRGQDLGVHYMPGSGTAPATEAQLRELRRKYYAIRK